jgi:predicted acetyltransferase
MLIMRAPILGQRDSRCDFVREVAAMPELIAPTSSLHEAFLAAHREWGPGKHEDGFGLTASDEIVSADGFATWIKRVGDQSGGRKPCTHRWIIDNHEVVGGIALRHELTEFVAQMGHIGYGIRPSARRRGLATWALGQMLEIARVLGLERVLIVCEADNLASAKVVEHHGGNLEDAPPGGQPHLRRYWITVNKNE